jgi:hypothetical protein
VGSPAGFLRAAPPVVSSQVARIVSITSECQQNGDTSETLPPLSAYGPNRLQRNRDDTDGLAPGWTPECRLPTEPNPTLGPPGGVRSTIAAREEVLSARRLRASVCRGTASRHHGARRVSAAGGQQRLPCTREPVVTSPQSCSPDLPKVP